VSPRPSSTRAHSPGGASRAWSTCAHRGQFTQFAVGLYPAARIFAFEPQPAPYAALARIAAPQARIRTFEAAIGPRAATVHMHLIRPDDSSSLLAPTDLQRTIFGTAERGAIAVQVAPLDAFITAADLTPPALLKLDLQGFELEALQGCAPLLDRFAAVYVECSFVRLYAGQALADEVLGHLRAHGFRLAGVYNLIRDRARRAVQADFLCVRRRTYC
jgi:FkbM family methyltransferase